MSSGSAPFSPLHEISELSDLIARYPTSLTLRRRRARLYLRQALFQQAQQDLEYLVERRPGAVRQLIELAECYRILYRGDDAIRASSEALLRATSTVHISLATFTKAACLRMAGRREEACALLQETLARAGTSRMRAAAAHHLCPLLAELGRLEELEEFLASFSGLTRTVLDVLDTVAHRKSDEGDFEGALPIIRLQLRLCEDPAQAANYHDHLAYCFASLNRHEETKMHCESALALEPKLANSWNTLGLTKFKLGDLDAAIDALNRAIEYDPHLAFAYENKGRALVRLERFQDALENFQQAMVLNPKNPWVYKNIADALTGLGDKSNAKINYQKAIRMGLPLPRRIIAELNA